MKISLSGAELTILREGFNPKFYGVVDARGESALLYYLKDALNFLGLHLVKKRMNKDGHLVDAAQSYLRSDKPRRNTPSITLWNGNFALHGLESDWNTKNVAVLQIDYDFFDEGKNRLREEFLLKNLLRDVLIP